MVINFDNEKIIFRVCIDKNFTQFVGIVIVQLSYITEVKGISEFGTIIQINYEYLGINYRCLRKLVLTILL